MSMKPQSKHRYVLTLAIIFAVLWIFLAINPSYPKDWALENAMGLILVLTLIITYKRFRLSRLSYTLIFIFLCLHTIGAHYTYAEVPYNEWTEKLFGRSLNSIFGWERNHYDRLVHFSYGFLMAYPIREFFMRVADSKGFWGYFFPLDITMSTSMLYELIEWGVALLVGGSLGMAYLGTQGDVWDAHKDMALATLGAMIAMTVTMIINACMKRDFARDIADSFHIKSGEPLGEEALARMWKETHPDTP